MADKAMWSNSRHFRSTTSVGSAHYSTSTSRGQSRSRQRSDAGGSTDRFSPLRMRLVRRAMLGAFLTVVAVVAGEIVFRVVLAPNLAITTVEVTGDSVLDRTELIDIAGLDSRLLYFHIDTDAVAARIEAVPEVRNAVVTRRFPDTLHIDVEARTALAVTSLTRNGTSVPAVVDSDGVVFRAGLKEGELDMPIVSGLRLERFDEGDSLPDELDPLFEDLHVLRVDYPSLYAMISELRIVRTGGRYETVLYPVHVQVPVRMPARAEPERYRAVIEGVAALRARGELDSISEMDLRSGDLVYTMRTEG